ncbi:MAG: DNA-3-methyladenine glycosylase I [Mycoplasmataceae bacterium]|nr:DNA-3-methyladenine glycosylase I [Mycoplasmataceae bacterium]
MKRCKWVNLKNEKYIFYHDNEWAKIKNSDLDIFESLILEIFQSGLSWEIILSKRENFRKAFDFYDLEKIVNYDVEKVNKLVNDKSIIRHKLKILALINNAKVFLEIQKKFSSFYNYIWSFTDKKIIFEKNQINSKLSDRICLDLKNKGMKFIGSTIIYNFLQAIGIINAHDKECFLYLEK